jgi:hypothetical protein
MADKFPFELSCFSSTSKKKFWGVTATLTLGRITTVVRQSFPPQRLPRRVQRGYDLFLLFTKVRSRAEIDSASIGSRGDIFFETRE